MVTGMRGLWAGFMAAAAAVLVGCGAPQPAEPLDAEELTPLLLTADELSVTPDTVGRPFEASGQETAVGVGLVPHTGTGACGEAIKAVGDATFTPWGSSAVVYEDAGDTLALGLYSLAGGPQVDTARLYSDVLGNCPLPVTDRDFLTRYAFAPLPDALRQRGAEGYVVTINDPVNADSYHSYVAHLPVNNHGVYLGATGVTEDTAVDAFLAQADKLEEGLR